MNIKRTICIIAMISVSIIAFSATSLYEDFNFSYTVDLRDPLYLSVRFCDAGGQAFENDTTEILNADDPTLLYTTEQFYLEIRSNYYKNLSAKFTFTPFEGKVSTTKIGYSVNFYDRDDHSDNIQLEITDDLTSIGNSEPIIIDNHTASGIEKYFAFRYYDFDDYSEYAADTYVSQVTVEVSYV